MASRNSPVELLSYSTARNFNFLIILVSTLNVRCFFSHNQDLIGRAGC
jgi:hypothetical protein